MMCRTKRNKAEELKAIINEKRNFLNIESEAEIETKVNGESYFIYIGGSFPDVNLNSLKKHAPIEYVANVSVREGCLRIQVKLEE